MKDIIPVFVNGQRVEVPRGATAADAAAGFDPAFATGAAAVALTDARGLPVAPDTVLVTGDILRAAASARRAAGTDADS